MLDSMQTSPSWLCAMANTQALPMVIKVLSKSMDTPLAVDKIEIATLTRDATTGQVGCSFSCHPVNVKAAR